MTAATKSAAEFTKALAAPFPIADIRFKAQAVKGDRALALPYIDARVVQERLDQVLGVDGWQDDYTPLPDGGMLCKLSLRFGEAWVTKSDAGRSGEGKERDCKSATSDALKRAAVKFGIGRYLYRLPRQWVPYDQQTKQLREKPRLPDWAMPADSAEHAGAAEAEQTAGCQAGSRAPGPARPRRPRTSPPSAAMPPAESLPLASYPTSAPPAMAAVTAGNGDVSWAASPRPDAPEEDDGGDPVLRFEHRVKSIDQKLAAEGKIQPLALVNYVVDAVVNAGGSRSFSEWHQGDLTVGRNAANRFVARLPKPGDSGLARQLRGSIEQVEQQGGLAHV